ncbi:hypothetical protein RHGRI_012902 [Rhododendron griersonianum]|uniref:Pentatricopeptide repeat-containing protein n=1 Tax=Rhododendron griersonianum TaxID=479676 RepID=A0AAV6K3K1_9ERIC|nr:hypothetical protein RHGRI_012902 [Rhododendron griersonianum]
MGLDAVEDMEDLILGSEIQWYVIKMGMESDICIVSTLMEMYGESGCSLRMSQVFDGCIRYRRLQCTVIAACSQNGKENGGFGPIQRDADCWGEEKFNHKPLYFTSLWKHCSIDADEGSSWFFYQKWDLCQSGFTEEEQCNFNSMSRKHGIEVDAAVQKKAVSVGIGSSGEPKTELDRDKREASFNSTNFIGPNSKLIWRNVSPFKVEILVWQAIQEKFATASELLKRNFTLQGYLGRSGLISKVWYLGNVFRGKLLDVEDPAETIITRVALWVKASLTLKITLSMTSKEACHCSITPYKSSPQWGRQVHGIASDSRLDSAPFVQSYYVRIYVKCSQLKVAHKVLDAMSEPDVVSWSALFSGYARLGHEVRQERS